MLQDAEMTPAAKSGLFPVGGFFCGNHWTFSSIYRGPVYPISRASPNPCL